jgi:hypothetical protein
MVDSLLVLRNAEGDVPPVTPSGVSLRTKSRDLGRETAREIPPLRSCLASVGMTVGSMAAHSLP